TSTSAACDSLDPIDEMRFTLLVQRAVGGRDGFITSPDMMRMGTLESARALGLDDRIGSLEVGKLADIVAVDLSHSSQVPTHFPNSAVIHTSDRDDVIMTMIDGKVVYDARDEIAQMRTIDVREISRAVDDIRSARTKLRVR
ncbi:MAG: amidohydrolase family protein, partial [Coriobacteriales bacterium]